MMEVNPLLSAPDGFQPSPTDPQLLAAGVQATFRTLDLSAVDGKAELMAQLSRDLSLPRHFGRNWDALYDVLSDPDSMRATVICLKEWEGYVVRQPELAARLEGVLLDAQEALASDDIPLWVLV